MKDDTLFGELMWLGVWLFLLLIVGLAITEALDINGYDLWSYL